LLQRGDGASYTDRQDGGVSAASAAACRRDLLIPINR
jgi:hypothetical protein